VLPGQGYQAIQGLDRLRLPQPVAGVDRQPGRPALLDAQLGRRIDQPALDPPHVDVQSRDAVGGDAVQVGIDQGIGQNRRVGRGNADGLRDPGDQLPHVTGGITVRFRHCCRHEERLRWLAISSEFAVSRGLAGGLARRAQMCRVFARSRAMSRRSY